MSYCVDCGRLNRGEGVDHLCAACQRARDDTPSCRVCGGPRGGCRVCRPIDAVWCAVCQDEPGGCWACADAVFLDHEDRDVVCRTCGDQPGGCAACQNVSATICPVCGGHGWVWAGTGDEPEIENCPRCPTNTENRWVPDVWVRRYPTEKEMDAMAEGRE